MAAHKLIIVDEADQFIKADTRPMIERYAQAPSDQATLVLRGSKWNKGKLDEHISKAGLILKCDAVDEGTASRWIQARSTKAYESSIDPRSAAMLVDRLGCDLGRIDTELAKLATAAGKGNPISADMSSARDSPGVHMGELGTTGTPAITAASLERILSPKSSMVSGLGPMKTSPASAHSLLKAGFSAKNP